MSHIDSKLTYQLKNPFKCADKNDGTMKDAEFIVFKECTGQVFLEYYSALQSHVNSAFMTLAAQQANFSAGSTDNDKTPQNEVKPLHEKTEEQHQEEFEQLCQTMSLCLPQGDPKRLANFVNAFAGMVNLGHKTNPIALINGDIPVSKSIWSLLSLKDATESAIQYCCFFGIGSLSQESQSSNTALPPVISVKEL